MLEDPSGGFGHPTDRLVLKFALVCLIFGETRLGTGMLSGINMAVVFLGTFNIIHLDLPPLLSPKIRNSTISNPDIFSKTIERLDTFGRSPKKRLGTICDQMVCILLSSNPQLIVLNSKIIVYNDIFAFSRLYVLNHLKIRINMVKPPRDLKLLERLQDHSARIKWQIDALNRAEVS